MYVFILGKIMNTNLDNEEIELLNSYNEGEWVSIATPQNMNKYEQIAKNTLKKKQMNIEISSEDFDAIRKIAQKKGFSYQSLVTNILHNYAVQNP